MKFIDNCSGEVRLHVPINLKLYAYLKRYRAPSHIACISSRTHAKMYLIPRQHPFSNPQFDISPQIDLSELPNITKGITDALQLCETAGLDRNGVQCGLSVRYLR